jgi:hypothetical protein
MSGLRSIAFCAALPAFFLAACGGGAPLMPAPNPVLQPQRYEVWQRAENAARAPFDVDFVPAGGVTRVYQPDWAGPVLFAPGAKPLQIPQHRFHIVEGEWIVPAARPTINCSNPKEQVDGSSLWIALDGWMATFVAHVKGKDGKYHTYDSSDILQAGSESDVHCYHGGPPKEYPTSSYFWIEWDGEKNIAVTHHSTNLVVKPGDKIYVRIDVQTTGPDAWREATLYFVNETTGFYLPPRSFHSRCIDCGTPYQRPATLFGNTAEWMTEATFYSSGNRNLPNTLDDFGKVEMTNAFTTDQDGVVYDPSHPKDATPNVDWMTWGGTPLPRGGTLLACSTILGPRLVAFARAPYVIATPGQQGDLEPKPQHCR